MCEQPLVSVIIPVYNVEQYLYECIDSVVAQTYTNLEIILVDDGSTDGSGKICDEYAEKDERILVMHKKNEGVSSARNSALEISTGTYVAFIDADDYVDSNFINKLYMALFNNNVDIAICGYEKIGGLDLVSGNTTTKYRTEKIVLEKSGRLNTGKLWFHAFDTNFVGCYLWNKLFKKKFLDKMQFDRELCIGEDMIYLAQYLKNVNDAYYINEPLYKYRINCNSALNTTNVLAKDTVIKKIESAIEATEILDSLIQKEKNVLKYYVSYRKVRTSVWCIFKMVVTDLNEKAIFDRIKQIVRQNYCNYTKVRYGSKIQKIAVIGLLCSPKLVFIIGKIFRYLFPQKLYEYSRK